MQGRKKGGKGSHTTPGRNHYGAFFFAETFRSFSLRQIGHGNISVICLTFVFKRAVSVLISLYIQTFWPKRQNFFGHFRIISVYDRKMTEKNSYEAPNLCGGRRKVPTISQVLSSMQDNCFRETSVSNMGLKRALCPCLLVTVEHRRLGR